MTKLRVYEYAKQLNMSSKEIITILSRLNIPVNNHMSVMESEMVSAVEGFFSDVKARAAARTVEQERLVKDAAPKNIAPVAQQDVPAVDAVSAQSEVKVKDQVSIRSQPESNTQAIKPSVADRVVDQPVRQMVNDQGIIGARSTQEPTTRRSTSNGDNSQTGNQSGTRQSNYGNRDASSNRPPRTGDRPPYNRERSATTGNDRRQSSDAASRPNNHGGGQGYNGGSGRPQGQNGSVRPQGGSGRPQGQNGSGRPSGGSGYAGSGGQRSASNGGYGAPRTGGTTQGGNRFSNDAPRSSSDAGARSDANRRARPSGDRRPDQRSFGGTTTSGTAPRFGANAASSGGQNSAFGARKRTGDRNDSSRVSTQEKRENNRKLQPPRNRQRVTSNVVKAPEGPRQVAVDAPMSVGEFARLIRREVSDVIKKLLFLGMPATINQEIDTDTMVLLGAEYGTEVQVQAPRDLEAEEMLVDDVDSATLETRAPVVTIMGHVDHGKTTLLDAIRESNVIASEAGGITQHIGAYQVEINKKKITFLDTPGHAAFTTMRARGAQITDITILVVAADDGVMPQTVEAINHAKAANVPIIVAVNKMDKPGANADRIKQELTEHGLVAEEWGGDTIFVPMSAKQRQGIDELLEMILLVAEVADMKASITARSRGTVIESELDRGRGPVATVLVQNGTLHVGDMVVAGNTFGRIRAMVNDRGRRVKEALPSAPVEIVGLSDVPNAGDPFVVYDDERQARQVAERRAMRHRAEELGATTRVTLDDLYKQIQEGEIKDLNIILKADVHGSAEAVLGALQKIDISGVRVRVIHSGVGAITESDILLASASKAIVVGFNVRPEPNAAKMAESEQIDLRLYRVIYNLIDEIEAALKGMLDPEFKEVVIGHAEVRQLFKVSKVGTIAGCMVQEGKMLRDADIRVIRQGVIVFEGKLDSLKRFKDDAREVAAGYECGLTIERFNDLKEGDIVEAFKMEAIKTE